ncbi:hypothetical protein BHC44_05500 [Snodgrassella alvi]|uniref:DUF4124 domain-containing protein n=1 Tax=Snodgrassella alvi TaxID=1196083 RepID=A0A2N9Y0E0_9NEIS|nr:hypothetical protein BHC44_05500 [Snodgrassella alvi]PIT58228.1 hypothetical protein BHC49_02110 [Snodgrassella alvi]
MQNKFRLGLYFSACVLLSSYLNPVWAEDKTAASVASEPAPITWYACPLANNHVSYTTKPLDVQCQIAKHPPTDSDDLKKHSLENQNAPGLEQLQRLWYSAEFGRDSDLMKVPPTPKMGIFLRQQTPKPDTATAIKNKNNAATVPAKIIVVPKLTPKQLVQRDITSEQRALATAQQQLRRAQKQGIVAQIQRWQQNVTDRQANIRVLKQELSRY